MMDHSPGTPPSSFVKKYNYKSNKICTILIICFFYLFAIFSVLLIVDSVALNFDIEQNIKLQTEESKSILVNSANLFDAVNQISSFIFLVSAFIYQFWIYRASSNAHALNPQKKFEFSPGWSVGSNFIPIISFYWPYKVMKEIWISSMGAGTTIVVIWWITFLLMNFLSLAVNHQPPDNLSNLANIALLTAWGSFFGIIAALTAVRIMRKINKSQTNLIGGRISPTPYQQII